MSYVLRTLSKSNMVVSMHGHEIYRVFIIFSVITSIYNKKTIRPTLMEFFTATRKLKKFFFGNYNCSMCAPPVTRHTSIRYSSCCHTRGRVCGNNLNIVSMCAVSPVVHTSNNCSCQKKNFFSFLVAVKNSIKVGPMVFLL